MNPSRSTSPDTASAHPAATAAAAAAAGCPFHAAGAMAGAPHGAAIGPRYRRPLGVLHHRGVRAEIARLDAKRDCQRIVFLLSAYEFPFDMTRALEIALFHTYGSRSVSRLLDRTAQFSRHGQKRYDDTNLLIANFMEAGWDGDPGARAIARMNHIHSHYRIPNEDFLFVLWTFIDFPIEWMAQFGWRDFTAHECEAWFHYWHAIGQRMGLTDIPASKPAFDAFVAAYEAREFVPDEASRRVADATVAIMAAWLPTPLRGVVKPAAACLVRPQFRRAAKFPEPSPVLNAVLRGVLRLRRVVKRVFSIERYPTLLAEKHYRSYPQGLPPIEQIGPQALKRREPHP
ncbi:oxygenase MpaB family protein [Ideonella sp. DXS22W]|uniref:Oxygenase MpaB family protein n=1 Tax=Pseudaquabacterium inlustre TaxID=2984192 RepID=A0ABU9CP92_9BURK